MTLTKEQVLILAHKIYDDLIKDIRNDFESKKQEYFSKIEADINYVKELLVNSPVNVEFTVESFPNAKFSQVPKKESNDIPLLGKFYKLPYLYKIADQIVFEALSWNQEKTTTDQFIQNIKNKYVTN